MKTINHWMLYANKFTKPFLKLGFRKKYFKVLVCSFLIFLTINAQVFAAKSEYYRFSEDIYNQSKILTPQNLALSEDELNKKLQDELHRRKQEELGRNCIQRINDSIDILEEEFKDVSKVRFREKVIEKLEQVGASGPLVGMLSGSAIGSTAGPVGTLIGLGVGVAAGFVSSLGLEFLKEKLKQGIKVRRDPQDIIKKMEELKEKARELEYGLEYEPIGELERKYIKRKKDITDPNLQAEIERSLIQARSADYFFQVNTPAIGFALGLPLQPRPLLDPNDRHGSKSSLIKRFNSDPSFSIYSKEIRASLLDIITRIATNSVTSTGYSPLRVVEHWLGSGSTGKSTAAKEMARFLRLPYFEKRITSPESEINMTNFSGALRSFQGSPQLGWLAEALLQKVEGTDNESYQNGLLILDDYPVNTQNGQNLLLAITDPEKRKFPNNYLQSDLDISRLSILIISNENFKSLRPAQAQGPSPAKDNDPTFTALRSRFSTLIFPEFNEEQKKKMARPYLEETLVRKYKPPFFYKFEYVDPTQIKVTCDIKELEEGWVKRSTFVSTGVSTDRRNSITLRELKEVLEATINRYLNELIQSSNEFYESYKKNKGERALKAAAINGHPKAIRVLVQRKMSLQTLDEKKKTVHRIAEGFEKSGDINEAKKWWLECLNLGVSDIWTQILKYLPYKIETELDHKLLKRLLTFAKDHNEKDLYAEEIGNHLYLIGLYSKGCDRTNYLKCSAKLGNQEAKKTLEEDLLKTLPKKLENNVHQKVQMLSTLRDMVACLISNDPEIKMNGFMKLFLEDDRTLWNPDGAIRSLWRTQTISTDKFEQESTNTRALLCRVKRLHTQEDRLSVMSFHLSLVCSLADYLLNAKDFFRDKIEENDYIGFRVKRNISHLINHLVSLSSLENDEEWLSLKDKRSFQPVIDNYVKWFAGDSDTPSKAVLLFTAFSIGYTIEKDFSALVASRFIPSHYRFLLFIFSTSLFG